MDANQKKSAAIIQKGRASAPELKWLESHAEWLKEMLQSTENEIEKHVNTRRAAIEALDKIISWPIKSFLVKIRYETGFEWNCIELVDKHYTSIKIDSLHDVPMKRYLEGPGMRYVIEDGYTILWTLSEKEFKKQYDQFEQAFMINAIDKIRTELAPLGIKVSTRKKIFLSSYEGKRRKIPYPVIYITIKFADCTKRSRTKRLRRVSL